MFRKSTLLLIVLTSQIFAQSSFLAPYLTPDKSGMQLSPIIGGMKSSITNQETEIGMGLYYHDKYLLEENEELGFIEGRLISETPLSSFDLIKQITEDRNLALSNYGAQYRMYQEALRKFKTYQEKDPNNTNQIDNFYSEDYYEEYNNEDYYGEEYYGEEYYGEEYTEGQAYTTGSLTKIKQNFVAQIMTTTTSATTNVSAPPVNGFELELLIQVEKLKQQYQTVLSQYNALIEIETNVPAYSFDPGDPTEQFTIMIVGENLSGAWSKSFRLDGKTNYQSYNEQVWYLGYKIPLTKKDVRILDSIFTQNTNIRYIVSGDGGMAEFNFHPGLKNGVDELFTLFKQGKLKRNAVPTAPLLRE